MTANKLNLFDSNKGDIVVQVPPPIAGGQPVLVGLSKTSATTDPGVSTDSSLGYQAGSQYYNSTAKRLFECLDATAGAAVWVLIGDAASGTLPATIAVEFGAGTGSLLPIGSLSGGETISAAGLSPSVTGGDIVIGVFTIPGNSLNLAARGVDIMVEGSFASNTNTKTMKVIANPSAAVVGSAVTGGTTIATSGAVTLTGGLAFAIQARIRKYGAAGDNTQLCTNPVLRWGSINGALGAPVTIGGVEANDMLIAVTGNAATTTTDILVNLIDLVAKN